RAARSRGSGAARTSGAGSRDHPRVELVSHPALAELHPTGSHPESRARLAVLHERFAYVQCSPATEEGVLRCHRPELLELVRTARGWLDADTVCTESSFEAAMLAAGAAIEAVRREGFALGRPPGHHATAGRPMGFCLMNSAAIAARWAQAELGVGRVAILDWDVHHGNGTEQIFAGDPTVLYVSIHQWPFYPGTGGPDDQRETTVNIPLPAGCGDAEYLAAFSDVVEPAVRRFEPDLLLVSAGVDAHVWDPLADMRVGEDGFGELSRRCVAPPPRVAAVLEGGYELETLPALVAAALEGFGS